MGSLRTYKESVALITGAGPASAGLWLWNLRAAARRFALRTWTPPDWKKPRPWCGAPAARSRRTESMCATPPPCGGGFWDRRASTISSTTPASEAWGSHRPVCSVRLGPDHRRQPEGRVNGMHAAYSAMVDQGYRHIVNTASLAGLVPLPLALPYSAVKHAVVGLSKSLRVEAASKGVRVSVLCPGVIRTPILTKDSTRGYEQVSAERKREAWEQFRPIDPEPWARETLDRVAQTKPSSSFPAPPE